MNRLQNTILEEKDVVVDTQKRNTILTLIAWLKRILQSNDSNAMNTESQLFALTDLLPAELLLTKLMPQLNANNNNATATSSGSNNKSTPNDTNDEINFERSPASSKRFSRQRNHRFNTIGVSKEELADARLYLQKKLLTENLASTVDKPAAAIPPPTNIFNDEIENRRKSLNLSAANDLDSDIQNIFNETINSLNESIQTAAQEKKSTASNEKKSSPIHQNGILRRKSYDHRNVDDTNPTTDTDDDLLNGNEISKLNNGNSSASQPKSMNKFALRKLKMKRANTIDIPKNDQYGGNDSDLDNNQSQVHSNAMNKNLPEFQLKSANDRKYLAFMNKSNDQHKLSWTNPNKNTPATNKTNWSSKFGNIKSSFESNEQTKLSSPVLSKKNGFTHASTSPFKPVQNNRPPHVPNGTYPLQNQHYQVSQKISAIQNTDQINVVEDKPQLRAQKSMPALVEGRNNFHHSPSSHFKSNAWNQQKKHASVDSYVQNIEKNQLSQVNPLYSAPPRSLSNQEQKGRYGDSITPGSGDSYPQNYQRYSNERQIQSCDHSPSSRMNSFEQPTSAKYNSLEQARVNPYDQARSAHLNASLSPKSIEFPNYTFTSTDFTQPTCVSTFGPDSKPTTPIKATILPDTSYLKTSPAPQRSYAPALGSNRLSNQMKTIDFHSSSEYLSEPSSYYRSPKPFSPNFDRSPKPFSPTYDNPPYTDSCQGSQEFLAKSQIMKYPQSQTATFVNKPIKKRYETDGATLAPSTKYDTNPPVSPFSESNFSHVNQMYVPPEPLKTQQGRSKGGNFKSMDNLNATYRNDVEPSAPIRLRNNTTYYGSQAALPNQRSSYPTPESTQKPMEYQKSFESKSFDSGKSKGTTPAKLNSSGGQYIQPKVEPEDYTDAGPKFLKKSLQSAPVAPMTTFRNNAILRPAMQRTANVEIKRKQSLPAQNSDYFDKVYNSNEVNEPPSNQYLPSGVLTRSKSSHTLALLQQFEGKGNAEENVIPSYVKRPDSFPANEVIPKSVVIPSPKPLTIAPAMATNKDISFESNPFSSQSYRNSEQSQQMEQKVIGDEEGVEVRRKSVAEIIKSKESVLVREAKSKETTKVKAEVSEKLINNKARTVIASAAENKIQSIESKVKSAFAESKTASIVNESKTVNESKIQSVVTEARSQSALIRSKTPSAEAKAPPLAESVPEVKLRSSAEKKAPPMIESATELKLQSKIISKARSITESTTEAKVRSLVTSKELTHLKAPEIDETPPSPCVEDGHIIYPGQTQQTRNRVQHYAQTLNARLNRKSIVIEEDEEIIDDKAAIRSGVQKSKSGTLLSVPKQYESAIKKSEVEEKQRTVAAYFSGKNSQSLQRSSSQHSVLSSASMKSFSRNDDKSSTVSPLNSDNDFKIEQSNESQQTGSSVITTSTTMSTKSAHHLKILRKQQQKHGSPLAKSQTMPSINLLDETNVDDAFEEIFASFTGK